MIAAALGCGLMVALASSRDLLMVTVSVDGSAQIFFNQIMDLRCDKAQAKSVET